MLIAFILGLALGISIGRYWRWTPEPGLAWPRPNHTERLIRHRETIAAERARDQHLAMWIPHWSAAWQRGPVVSRYETARRVP